MKPKYLDKIKNTIEADLLALNGNRLLIELLEEPEKTTKSGIIVEAPIKKNFDGSDKARIAVVLAVGAGYETDDGEKVDINYKPGDHVLVNQFGVKTFGEFFGMAEYKPNTIGLITDDLIQGKVNNFEKFNEILKA